MFFLEDDSLSNAFVERNERKMKRTAVMMKK